MRREPRLQRFGEFGALARGRIGWAIVVAAVSVVLVLPALGSAQRQGAEPLPVFVDGVYKAPVEVEAPWISATITVEIGAGTATTVFDDTFSQETHFGDTLSCTWIGHSLAPEPDAAEPDTDADIDSGGGGAPIVPIVIGVAVVGALAAGVTVWRRKNERLLSTAD